jgi:hypothetical protein
MDYIVNKFFVFFIFGAVLLSLYGIYSAVAQAESPANKFVVSSFHVDMYEDDAKSVCKKMKPSYTWLTDSSKGFHASACVADMPKKRGATPHYLTKQPAFIVFDVQGKQIRNLQAVYFEPQQWSVERTRMENIFDVFQNRYIQLNGVDSKAPIYYSKNDNAYIQAYVIEPDPAGILYEFDSRHTWMIQERLYAVEINQDKKYR